MKRFLLFLAFGLTLFTGMSAHAQEVTDGTWRKDPKSDIWQTDVVVQGNIHTVNTFLLRTGKATLFVHEKCPQSNLKKITVWSPGDPYAVIRTCEGKDDITLEFHILIERELTTGLPRSLRERLREIHKKKPVGKSVFTHNTFKKHLTGVLFSIKMNRR